MAEQKKINERLIALVCLGIVAFNYPLLGLFSKKWFFSGVPLLYLYIFSLWFLFIIVLALIIRKRPSPASTSGKRVL
ncbi:MAG: hypothetical protein KKG47_11710 [Proteobacteria bacterium]|nr:hypothetical protein [Pseudomonadota bacterium]MBU1739478.1 hypothetical protein [Pseudomonadota bacterium]